MSSIQSKSELRQRLLKQRHTMRSDFAKSHSDAICELLIQTLKKVDIEGIIFYYPLKNEVNLLPAIDALINDESKIVGFPHYTGSRYEFGQVNHKNFTEKWEFYTQFFSGKFGAKEPKETTPWPDGIKTLILVPGLAFDRNGHRLGFGKGNYDRLLGEYDAKTLGICYDWQIIDQCPVEAHDIPVDDVLTERGFVKHHG